MAGELQPLDEKFAIVDDQGRPTLYFIKWCQQRQIDITDALTLLQLEEYFDTHKLQEGSGIQFNPDGNIKNSPIISADAQEILDQISTTRGTVLYRGLLGWAGLAPGTAGQFLKTNGAGADPAWAAGGGGGGSVDYEASPRDVPLVADFTWNNQGTATAVNSLKGGIIMNSTTTGINLRQLEKVSPGGTFSIYANVRELLAGRNNSNQAGIHLRNSTTGRIVFLCINPAATTGFFVISQNWTNVTTFSANIAGPLAEWEEVNWLRLDVTATGYTPYASTNGWDWVALGATTTFASFLTAAGGTVDRYGITLQNNGNPYYVWFPSFGLNAPVIPPNPTAGLGWTTLYSNAAIANPTTNIDIDVTAYNDVLVTGRLITLAASGYRSVSVSVDGGATFYKTTGDYVTLTDQGVEANNFIALNHNTQTALGRSMGGMIQGLRVNGVPKLMINSDNTELNRLFVASLSPITHIRIAGISVSAGALINMTGGQLYVLGR